METETLTPPRPDRRAFSYPGDAEADGWITVPEAVERMGSALATVTPLTRMNKSGRVYEWLRGDHQWVAGRLYVSRKHAPEKLYTLQAAAHMHTRAHTPKRVTLLHSRRFWLRGEAVFSIRFHRPTFDRAVQCGVDWLVERIEAT
jgi:hypothetical protein